MKDAIFISVESLRSCLKISKRGAVAESAGRLFQLAMLQVGS